jgi:hypothetical protein
MKLIKIKEEMKCHALKFKNDCVFPFLSQATIWYIKGKVFVNSMPGLWPTLCDQEMTQASPAHLLSLHHSDIPHSFLFSWPHGASFVFASLLEFP